MTCKLNHELISFVGESNNCRQSNELKHAVHDVVQMENNSSFRISIELLSSYILFPQYKLLGLPNGIWFLEGKQNARMANC